MKKFATVVAAPLAMLFAANVFAMQPKPAQCPNVSAIKEVGLMQAERDDQDGFYIAGSISNYNTPDNWVFAVLMKLNQASSTEDALKKARKALPTLSGNPKPFEQQDHWICMYSIGSGYYAVSVTPVDMASTAKAIK